jgi:hypothetical protein
VLDFLNLKDIYSESDMEAAILRELESFILELGAGFTFVARQKRMAIDNEDFKIAEYLTELPPEELLEKKLHAAIEKSRALLEQRAGESKEHDRKE